jgi:putative ABC transport system permease protein
VPFSGRYGTDVLNPVSLGVRPLLFLGGVITLSVLVAIAAASRAFSIRLSGGRGVASSRLAAGRTLVSAQVGLSLVLVTSAVLLVKSFGELNRVDPASKPTASMPAGSRCPPSGSRVEKHGFLQALLESSSRTAQPASSTSHQRRGKPHELHRADVQRRDRAGSGRCRPNTDVLAGLLQALLAQTDSAQAPRVVVINESLAKKVAGVGNPVGQTLAFDFVTPPYVAQVAGVVADIRHDSLGRPGSAEAYFPYEQTPQTRFSIVMSGPANSRDAARTLRAAIHSVDPAQAFSTVVPTADYVRQNLAQPRVEAQLAGSFAAVALVIAASGLYSLLTFLVAGSRREWAVRLALGASHRHLLRLVFGQSATYAAVGVVVGLVLLFLARTTIASLVYGVSMWDPYIVIGCAAVIVGVCLLSATIPAFRAGRISAAESIANTP